MASALDLPVYSATAAASPSVAIMDAARAKREAAEEDERRKRALQDSEQQRADALASRAAAGEQREADKARLGQQASQMTGEMMKWDDPLHKGIPFSEDPLAREHFTTKYPDVADRAGKAWNDTQSALTGQIVGMPGLPKLEPNQSGTVNSEGKATITDHKEPTLKVDIIPADIKSELARLNKWKEGMTLEEAGKAREDAYLESGMIPEKYQTHATKLMGQIAHNPILAPFAKQREAYETMKSGFDSPESGGFGDMAMIEGFQRIVNPGATVRQATMANMKTAAGWLQNFDKDFQWNKAVKGDTLSPEARKRLMELADHEFSKAQRTASRELASKRNLARMMGIPSDMAGKFVDSVLTYVANDDGIPTAPTTSAAPTPTATTPAQPVAPSAPAAAPIPGLPPPGAKAPAPGATSAPIQVKTAAEATALPPGTVFLTPDGRRKIR